MRKRWRNDAANRQTRRKPDAHARYGVELAKVEKHVKWDTEYKTLETVCEDVLNRDWAQLAQLLTL